MSELRRNAPDYPAQSAKVRVGALASRQFGRVSRRQLRGLGVTNGSIADWVATSYLHRRLPGIYAVGHTAASVASELASAILYAGPGAMLSHATAAWWLGLIDRAPDSIQVTTPRRCLSLAGVEVHERRELERTWHGGLPVAPVGQVLLDLATTADPERLRRALAEAEYRGWLELDVVRAMLGRGRPGSAALRRALARHEPRLALTRSELERRLLALCERHGLPLPEFNVTVEGLLVDALWDEQRVVVEVDGAAGHSSWAQIQRDRERDLRLRAAGYVVLRYTWRQITGAPEAVAADLGAALNRIARSAGRESR